jgi:hypothetical protein
MVISKIPSKKKYKKKLGMGETLREKGEQITQPYLRTMLF